MAIATARPAKSKAAPKNAPPSKAQARTPVAGTKQQKGSAEPQSGSGPALNAEERNRLVAQAAYFRAEKRGFAPGCELQDWVEAEAEVLRLIGSD
ncbi:MAG: DUF2934 domain-containing protein [Hyphomicrobium sp.]|nr:DUF2934 domain-containing protein [Hyphomicrobium sp.]